MVKIAGKDLLWLFGHTLQWGTLLGSVFCGVLGSVYVLFGFIAAGGRLLALSVGIALLWWYVRGRRLPY